jgi:uncharacterized integral membrane protein
MSNPSGPSRRTLLTYRRLTILLAIAVGLGLLALFVADNYVLVGIRLMNLRLEMRLAWALMLSFIVGGVVGYLVGWLRRPRRRPPAA